MMSVVRIRRESRTRLGAICVGTMAFVQAAAPGIAAAQSASSAAPAQPGDNAGGSGPAADGLQTETPIKHLIVIVGENRSFDHVFGLYQPGNGQTVSNLLSKGILNADGTPGPNFSQATQYRASSGSGYSISPGGKTPYETLPPPNTDSAPQT